MDRPTTRMDADARGSRLQPHEAFVLPSRRPALDLCRATLRAGTNPAAAALTGPILVTGDAGIGKTWLWRRLQAESLPSCRWVGVELTPANDPFEFYRLVAHELGLIGPSATGFSRIDLVDFLTERLADGERLVLAIEEAHNLSMPVWEEVRVLANRLDQPGGFVNMVLVGQTSLARRFSTRPFASIEARLASRVHLGPIDADEAKELLTRLRPGRDWPIEEVEILHRDSAGNPRRLLRRLGPVFAPAVALEPAPPEPAKLVGPTGPPSTALMPQVQAASPAPLLGPVKPPIRVEENMIEVGWSPDDAAPPEPPGRGSAPATAGSATLTVASEETVNDHYAALQAWREWSENQSRRSPLAAGSEDEDELEPEEPDIEAEEREPWPSPLADRSTVRAEGEQKFAPFGQLFSKMAQSIEPEKPA